MENILLKEAIIMANSNNMCRLCLSANGITEPICYDQRDQFLLQKIYECTTLQISPLNGIPSSLCTICKARLDEFYQFRWQCIKNDEIIRRIADNFQKQSPENPNAIIAAATIATGQASQQNPKQEIIEPPHHPNGELQITPVDGGGPSAEYHRDERRPDDARQTPVGFPHHPEHVEPQGYHAVDHAGHGQYAMGSTMAPTTNTVAPGGEFAPEVKYSVPPMAPQQQQQQQNHSYEFSDFRRKRGRPPKQKYDQYHHPIVKYGESSTESGPSSAGKDGSDSSSATTALIDEPETILSYGEGSSRGTEYHQQPGSGYEGWVAQPKIKLEQIDPQGQQQHPGRYDEQMSPIDVQQDQQHIREGYMKLPGTSTTQALLTPDGFVKRSRGRPPREGGCPNQDRTEYRFQCQFCDARFKAAINLKLHTNTHTGERPYKCQLCDKSFAHPSNLSVHTKLHTQERIKREGHNNAPSEKKFQCPYCHTLFALAFQLKIHINTHTGQKPYVCKNCGKGFAQPSNLHVHTKKHCHKRLEFEGQPQQQQRPPIPPLPEVPDHQHHHHHHQQQQQHHYQQMVHHPALTVVPVPSHSHSPEDNHHPPAGEHQQQHHSPPLAPAASTPQQNSLAMPPVMLS